MRSTVKVSAALVLVAVVLGAAGGLGAFTFVYADGSSYLKDDPAACANCHIMQEQFDGWNTSSHRAVATCNDCHTPESFLGKYLTKISNGYHHSLAFTTGRFHQPIAIKPHNRAITEARCRDCHASVVAQIDTHGTAQDGRAGNTEHDRLDCIRCHQSVGHLH